MLPDCYHLPGLKWSQWGQTYSHLKLLMPLSSTKSRAEKMPPALNPTRASRSATATDAGAAAPAQGRPVATVVTAVLQDLVWQSLQYPWVGRQQNVGYKQEVAAWDDPPSDSDDNDDDEDDDASTIKMVQRLMR